MKLRATGTREECDQFVAELSEHVAGWGRVLGVSGFYPNRGVTVLGRVFVEPHLLSARTGGGSQ